MITPTHHEKMEWSRFATASYAINRNDLGHEYSVAAALRNGEAITITRYDELQSRYRAWLVFNEFQSLDDYRKSAVCAAGRC